MFDERLINDNFYNLKMAGGLSVESMISQLVLGSGHGEEIPDGVEPEKDRMHFTCTCCGRRFYGMGNDALPLERETWGVEDGPRACGDCDENIIIPTRGLLNDIGFDWRNTKMKPYQRKRLKKAVLSGKTIDRNFMLSL